MAKKLTVGALLDRLAAERLLSPARRKAIEAPFAVQETVVPWYIYGLISIAAWFSALFFIIFLFAMEIINVGGGTLVAGVIFCTIAIFVPILFRKSIFFEQLALAASIAGQTMVIMGVADLSHSILAITSTVVALQIAMSFLYRHPVQIFAAPGVSTIAILAFCFDEKMPQVVYFIVAVLAVVVGFLWYREALFARFKWQRPFLYGVTVTLLGVVGLSVISALEPRSSLGVSWWISTAILGLCLLFLESTLMSKLQIAATSPTRIAIFAVTALVCLACYNSPGIVVALFIALLGFHRGNLLLTSMAFAFFAGFLFFYYYSLDITLLNKSLVLMGSGLLLLGLRAYLSKQFVATEV